MWTWIDFEEATSWHVIAFKEMIIKINKELEAYILVLIYALVILYTHFARDNVPLSYENICKIIYILVLMITLIKHVSG
jgi:hypothetical protein